MKIYIPIFLLMLVSGLPSCTGPRNIYSASPFISPVRMEKGATAAEINYFSHTTSTQKADSVVRKDNCFGLNISHMLKEKMLVFVFGDSKKDRNIDSIDNAGFDSSFITSNRHTIGAGIEFFSKEGKGITSSFAVSLGLHRFDMNESGLLMQAPYQRFYKLNQLSLSLQQNFLFKPGKHFKLAWINRLTILNSFKALTDYSSEEKFNTGLQDRRTNVFLGLIGFYVDYHPIKNIPLYINAHLFNDLILWKDVLAKPELGRVYIKGTGVSTGMKYIFK